MKIKRYILKLFEFSLGFNFSHYDLQMTFCFSLLECRYELRKIIKNESFLFTIFYKIILNILQYDFMIFDLLYMMFGTDVAHQVVKKSGKKHQAVKKN